MADRTLLRPDAPSFIPSFASPELRVQDYDSRDFSKERNPNETYESSKNGINTQRRISSGSAWKVNPSESVNDSGKNSDKARKGGRNRGDRRKVNENQDESRTSETQSSNSSLSQRQGNRKSSRSGGPLIQSGKEESSKESDSQRARGRRRRQGRNRQPSRNQPAGEESEHVRTEEEVFTLPLHAESFFPSLVAQPEKSEKSSVWVPTKKVFESPPSTGTADTLHRSQDQPLALQSLTLLSKGTNLNRNNSTERSQSAASQDLSDRDPDPVEPTNIQDQETTDVLARPRKKFHMSRLRDKWWDTLAQTKVRKQFQEELQYILKDRMYDPPVEDTVIISSSPLVEHAPEDAWVEEHVLNHQRGDESVEDNTITTSPIFTDLTSYSILLRRTIEKSDEDALKSVLSVATTDGDDSRDLDLKKKQISETEKATLMEQALLFAVELDKPKLLRVILSITTRQQCGGKTNISLVSQEAAVAITPLMLAAQFGHDECVSVFLAQMDSRSSSLLSARDSRGNNIFHYCCRGSADVQMLRTLLKEVSGTTKGQQQVLSKLLLTKNESNQTPLHMACQNCRVDLVEAFLSTCSSALLSKMAMVTDIWNQTPLLAAVAANATDVVMSFIMWRGNHHHLLQKTSQTPSKVVTESTASGTRNAHLPPCPLVWASKAGNLDMVLLLLEFSDPSGREYHITEALHASLLLPPSCEVKLDCIRVLVQAGGNPFQDTTPLQGKAEDTTTAVNTAASSYSIESLKVLVDTGRREVQDRQAARRRDPTLQQQPESFFEAIEGKESSEMQKALSDSLVQALVSGGCGSRVENENTVLHLAAASTLYHLGANLREKDLVRLRSSLVAGQLQPEVDISDDDKRNTFLATYCHPIGPKGDISQLGDIDRSVMSYWSRTLWQMPWMRPPRAGAGSLCSFADGATDGILVLPGPIDPNDRFVLIAEGYSRFVVHGSIVSQKSAKLAAAVRFATMNSSETLNESPEIQVGIDPRLCHFLLQHIYHGSVSFGWSKDCDQNTRDILELMIVAEEFLCPSLAQECEMRLLSSSPKLCFCWSCAFAVRKGTGNLAECMFYADSSSRLITANTALDILAVVEHLEAVQLEYTILCTSTSASLLRCIQPSRAWFLHDSKTWNSTKAIVTLKDAAICAVLNDFCTVLESDAYQESMNMDDNDVAEDLTGNLTPEVMLLRMCLEELALSPFSSLDDGAKNKLRKSTTK